MTDKPNLVRALRGLSSILVEATLKTTTIVEDMHQTIASGPPALGSPLKPVVKLYTKPIYGGIRGITGLVGIGVERALRQIEPAFEDVSHPDVVEMVRAAINGVVGDHLALTENPLAIEMQVRVNDGTLDFDTLPKERPLLIYIHGSAMSDIQLMRNGHHHGQKLAQDFGRASQSGTTAGCTSRRTAKNSPPCFKSWQITCPMSPSLSSDLAWVAWWPAAQ